MADYKLHCFVESGNAYKAALMLALTKADWEAVPVRFFDGQTRDAAWREGFNEMVEAPVLEHRGERISQSGVILDYLAGTTGQFGPRDAREGREIWRWILFDNHKYTSYFATLRFLYGISKTGETPVTEWLRGRVKSAFGIVDKHLSTNDFLVGGRPTIADLSLIGYHYYTEETGLDRDAMFPNIARWGARIANLPGWAPPATLMPPSR